MSSGGGRYGLAGLAITALVIVAVSSCSRPMTIEQQVISVIREMEALIENGERRQFISHVAEDFNGQNGELNRQQLQGLVIYQLNRHQRLHAQLFPINVDANGEEAASATFKALITGGPGWLPKEGQLYQFDTRWRYEDGEWKLSSASWKPVPLDEIL